MAKEVDVSQFILEDLIHKHGAPRELLSNRGRAFVSQLVAKILQLCVIAYRKMTA